MGVSACSAGIHPPEGPPICTALNFRPLAIPPPISSITCLTVIPIGTSINPPRATLPARANTFVPFEESLPIFENHSPPLRKIAGIFARRVVSYPESGEEVTQGNYTCFSYQNIYAEKINHKFFLIITETLSTLTSYNEKFFVLCTYLLLISCQEDKTSFYKSKLHGHYDFIKAYRNGKSTNTLQSGYFVFFNLKT